MGLPIEGQVGPQVLSDGSRGLVRLARDGSQIAQSAHADLFESAFRKQIFSASVTAQAMTVPGTGMVGLQLYNQSTDKLLSLIEVGGFIYATSATTTGVSLIAGNQGAVAPTGQTGAAVSRCTYLGASGPVAGLALAAGTFAVTGGVLQYLMHNTAAIATTGEDPGFRVNLNGRVIVPPGYFVAIAAFGATAAATSTNLDITWEEVPL